MAKQLYEVLVRFYKDGTFAAHAEYRDWESGQCETLPLDSPVFPAADRDTVTKLLGARQADILSRGVFMASQKRDADERVYALEKEVGAARTSAVELRSRLAKADAEVLDARAALDARQPVAEPAPKSLLNTLTFGLLK